GWRRRCGDHLCCGKPGEEARYIVAGVVAYSSALTTLCHDVFVVPCNDRPAGVQADLFIADHRVPIVFPAYHLIRPTVLHSDRFPDSLREERGILSDRVAAVMAVTTGALDKYDLDIRRGNSEQVGQDRSHVVHALSTGPGFHGSFIAGGAADVH